MRGGRAHCGCRGAGCQERDEDTEINDAGAVGEDALRDGEGVNPRAEEEVAGVGIDDNDEEKEEEEAGESRR